MPPVTAKNVNDFLGVKIYDIGLASKKSQVGQVTGLAWTQVGGELLTIESVIMPGKGKINLTGKLGDVMKESAQAAMSYIRVRYKDFGIDLDVIKNNEIHIHVPAGAVPKDGPSAGVAMATSIISALTGEAPEAAVAMTGEITLHGKVLPIGGVKEKVLAAVREGMKMVILPESNKADWDDLPTNAKKKLSVKFATDYDQAWNILFNGFDGANLQDVTTTNLAS